jgi:hypothetical protein
MIKKYIIIHDIKEKSGGKYTITTKGKTINLTKFDSKICKTNVEKVTKDYMTC